MYEGRIRGMGEVVLVELLFVSLFNLGFSLSLFLLFFEMVNFD